MNSVWYKFRSATTWRELQIPSTFLTIGEMRQLICKELHLQEQETVLLSENGDDNYRPLADEKQFPRGSRFWARRTTLDHIRREKEVLEHAQRANDAQEAEKGGDNANDDSDDDFGPDLFDRDAQLKYEERERRTQLEAVADQIKEEQKHDLKESMRPKDGARPSASLDDKAAKVDHKRVSVRVVDEEDDMDIDWESIIEQRKTSKAGEVKQEPTDTTEDDKTTALANVSHAVTAAQGPGELLEAHEDKEDPKSNHVAEKPAVPSLLETYPQLLNICSHILPNAPLKQLYLAFPNARPRSRAEWEAFQNAQREAQKEVDEMRNKTDTHGRGPRASSPGPSPRRSRHPQRHSRDRDISPSAADSPRRSHHNHEPRRRSSRSRTSRSQSREAPARRSPYEGGYEGGSSYPGRSSHSPDGSRRRHQRVSRQRSYSPDSASDRRNRSQSPPFERYRSRSRSPSESAPPRCFSRERKRSQPEQDLRYASDAPTAHTTRHRSPYEGGSSRGGLRGRAHGGGSGSEHDASDQKNGGRGSYEPPKDLRRRPPNREGSYTPPPDRKRAAEKSSPGYTVPRGRKHANSSGGFARRALGGIIR